MYRAVLFATVALLGVATLTLSLEMLPVRYGDAEYFMPPSINYAAGKGLANPWHLGRDPQGGRLIWHGYLMPQLYGALLWKASYRALVLLQAATAILVLALSGLLFQAILARPSHAVPAAWAATASLMLAGLLPPLFSGRPEPLAALLLVSAVLVLRRAPLRHHWWILAIALALLAMTAPAAGLISALATAVYYCWIFPRRPALLALLASGLLAAATVAATTALVYPFGLAAWLRGVFTHVSALEFPHYAFFSLWFLQARTFAYGVWLIAAGLTVLVLAREKLRSTAFPTGVVVFGLLLASVCWWLGVWIAARNYNLLAFAPLACALLLKTLPDWLDRFPMAAGWRKSSCTWLLALMLGLPALGTVKMLLCSLVPQPGTLSYGDARRLVERLRAEHPKIALSSGLFTLSEEQDRVEIADLHFGTSCLDSTTAEILVLQQAKFVWPNSPAAAAGYPPEILGFKLIDDHFTHCHPTLWGLPLAYSPESYNLAVYRRVAAD